MSASILQINFSFDGSWAEYETANAAGAAQIAGVPGLGWKIWLKNVAMREAGGIYLFHDETAAQGFAAQIEAILQGDSQFSNLSIKHFGVIEGLTAVTRGPIAPMARAKTFGQMATEALAAVPGITAAEAHRRLEQDPHTLVIDVRDAADIAITGTIPGALTISYGALTYQADQEVPQEWRALQLADRSRPIITTCILGPLGALGGKLLHDMGFTNVSVLEGGVQAWIEAGLPVAKNGGE